MKNLVITGGNSGYFEYLVPFITSIRENDKLDNTVIVVCDNTIKGKWNKPGSFKKGGSFSLEQLEFFDKNKVEVVVFSKLLKENNFSTEIFDNIKTGHWAYPAKYIYCYLIAKNYRDRVEKVAFFDADIYIQKDISKIFGLINGDQIYLNHEFSKIGDSSYMTDWIKFSKEHLMIKSLDIINIQDEFNICTGFFAGKIDVFLRDINFAVVISSNPILAFHSDQPLMNILVYVYNFPYIELGEELVHMAHIERKDTRFENNTFIVKEKIPTAIHYHGPLREWVKSIIVEDYDADNNQPSLLEKIKFRIKKSLP
ncbi:hypothetical protein [Winogradskyella costae]|uniref:hypothetical protein n=1 Tax=Winogradskyella costae TaxID=2697008 RepID=UPI0015C93E16|nr:hypothetical protein [Winogradskyella costae]